MITTELIELARRYFLADDGLSQANLIRKIQVAQGNPQCFATGKRSCDQSACPWREDCLTNPGVDLQTSS
jgi:hypothetical protein